MALGAYIHRRYFPLPFGLTTGLNALGFFCIGHWMKLWFKDISFLHNIAWYYKLAILVVWVGLGWFVRNKMASCENPHFPLNFVTGICGTIICYYLSLWINRSTTYINKALQIVGQYTISILIIHKFIADYGWLANMDYDNNLLFIVVTIMVAMIYITIHYNLSYMLKYGNK